LTDHEAHDLLIQAFDVRVLPVTKLPDVLQEWRQPCRAEFRDERTAWRLFNAFTETLNGNLPELPRRNQGLHGLMDAACGLATTTAYRTEDAEVRVAMAG
jgi:hypothetical protein